MSVELQMRASLGCDPELGAEVQQRARPPELRRARH